MKALVQACTLFLFMTLLGAPSLARAQSCTQTLSPGANVASAVSSASNGSVICLNSGSYGTVNFTNIQRGDFVTVRSASGQGARMSIGEVYNSRFIRFDSLTFDSVAVRECSSDIQFLNSTWSPGGGGMVFMYGTSCSQADMRLVVDGATFASVGRAGYEGRLSVRGVRGLTIKNSTFSGQPSNSADASDGVMLVGGSTNVTIGPGNVFRDILQPQCGSVHCDAIQMYGNGSGTVITGNYFSNNTVHIGNYDGGSPNMKVTHNIFDRGPSGQHLQIGGVQGMLMEHNTFRGVVLGIGTKSADSPHSGWVVQNNIFDGANFIASGDQPGCGSDCVMRNNLKSNGGSTNPTGSNSIVATAVYLGVGSVTNWLGWQLASGSPGKGAATDGKDIGVVFGSSTTPPPDTTPPPAPMNLTVR
jgi:Right handed beta helix region